MAKGGSACWLVKTEPSVYSIVDLKRDKSTHWHGVRNYQARNFLREMKTGDLVLVYHSSEEPVGIAGLARVSREAYPDPTQFEKAGEYFDPAATKENPRWFCPDLEYVETFPQVVPLARLRSVKALKDMVLLQRGSRLSVQPVSSVQFALLRELVAAPEPVQASKARSKRA